MSIIRYAGNDLTGLSGDTKPTTIPDGARFYETDTGKRYLKVSGSWVAQNAASISDFDAAVVNANAQGVTDLLADRPGYWFDGDNDVITVSDDADLDFGVYDGSIGMLFKSPSSSSTDDIILLTRYQNSSNILQLKYLQSSTTLRLFIVIGGVNTIYTAATFTFVPDTWYYVQWVVDRDDRGYLYVNGNNLSLTTDITLTTSLDIAADLEIAKYNTTYSKTDVTLVRQFNLALDDTDPEDKVIINGGVIPYKYIGASQTEQITIQANRDFSGAVNWVDRGLATYDVTGDMTITSDSAGQHTDIANTYLSNIEIGKTYRLSLVAFGLSGDDFYIVIGGSNQILINPLVSGLNVKEFTVEGATNEAQTLRVASGGTGGITLDDFSLTQIGCVLDLNPTGITDTTWIDASGNDLDGTVSGAIATNNTVAQYEQVNLTNSIYEADLKLDTGPTNTYVLTADSTKSGGMKWGAVSPAAGTNISWTAGTSAGPICNSSTGSDSAIPVASGAASGVVTTTTQTIAGWKTFTSGIKIAEIDGRGTAIQLTAGESYSQATGLTAEQIYLVAEGGMQVISSPDNWASLWAGRNTTLIGQANGNSIFPGDITLGANAVRDTELVMHSDVAGNYLNISSTGTAAGVMKYGTNAMYIGSASAADLYLRTTDINRITISAAGAIYVGANGVADTSVVMYSDVSNSYMTLQSNGASAGLYKNGTGPMYVGSISAETLSLLTTNIARLTISSAGTISVGTNAVADTTMNMFSNVASDYLSMYSYGTSAGVIKRGTTAFTVGTYDAASFLLKSNNVTRMTIASAGGITIGSNGVAETSMIWYSDVASSYVTITSLGTYAALWKYGTGILYVGTNSTEKLILRTNNTDRFTIDGTTGIIDLGSNGVADTKLNMHSDVSGSYLAIASSGASAEITKYGTGDLYVGTEDDENLILTTDSTNRISVVSSGRITAHTNIVCEEGLSLGFDASVSATGSKNCIEISTNTDIASGTYNNHTGIRLASGMSGAWGTAILELQVSSTWKAYGTTSIKMGANIWCSGTGQFARVGIGVAPHATYELALPAAGDIYSSGAILVRSTTFDLINTALLLYEGTDGVVGDLAVRELRADENNDVYQILYKNAAGALYAATLTAK